MYYDFYFRANDYGNYKVNTSSGTYSFGDIYSYTKTRDNQGKFRAWDYNYNQPLVYYTDVVLTYDTSKSGFYTLTSNSSLGHYSISGSFVEF